MRVCKIDGCKSKASDANRSLFEIKDEEIHKWLPYILAQPIGSKKKIYVCDLHFHQSDLFTNGKNLRMKKNAMPHSSIQGSCLSANDGPSFNSDNSSTPVQFNSAPFPTTTISMEVYKRLVAASVNELRGNEVIKKLEDKIKKQQIEIERIKQSCPNTSYNHLTPEQKEVLENLANRTPNSREKYAPTVRAFCLRILFFSTAGYNELRNFFGKRLPACGTLRKWLRSVDASPGISNIALNEVSVMAREYREKGKKLFLCLISDEMHIRKQVTWNENTKSFQGFPTDGSKSGKKMPVANEALVFMAAGEDFKIPVAYFIINGLDATDRAALTKEVITAVDNTGAKVISITNDGLRANLATAKLLGADLQNGKTEFPRPNRPNEKIHVILDPSHMLKLVRGYFAYHQLYYKEDKLKWNLLEKLVEKQDLDNFEFGNKLSRSHIKFKEAPMNVALAVQTISNSAADSIEQLSEDGYEDFIGSESTVEFMRLTNDVYDTMNFANGKPSDNRFKKALCTSNIDDVRLLYNKYEEFIQHIAVEDSKKKTKKSILKSRINTGFLGFLTNMKSTLGLFTDYVQNGPLEMLQTFQYSQDHIETYFSLIRSSLGANNNPNEIQFKSAYRKLLVCMPYLSARKTNCILSSTNILTVSSKVEDWDSTEYEPDPKEKTQAVFIEINHEELNISNSDIEPYESHIRALVASNIEQNIRRKILKASKSACQECVSVFNENDKIWDSFIAKKSRTRPMTQPCSSTVDIISVCDGVFEILQPKGFVSFDVMARTILNALLLRIRNMYEETTFEAHQNANKNVNGFSHREQFVYNIICEYMHLKSHKIGKRINIEEQNGRAIRRRLTRNVILAGQ